MRFLALLLLIPGLCFGQVGPVGCITNCTLGGQTVLTGVTVTGTNTGTVGAVTINQKSGRVNIAAAGSSVVVTNSTSATASKCFVNLQGAQDTTAKGSQCDTSVAGQLTIRLNAAATAQVAIDFLLVD